MVHRLRLIGVLLLLCSRLLAQNYPVRHFTVEDGLPSNTIYYVYRDSKGFLWVCTNKGVARYNGIKFEKFTTFHGLADNEVFAACEDGQGRLWFSSYNGELCYYENDSFHNPGNTPFLRRRRKESHIQKMFRQKDGSIIFTYNKGDYFCHISKDVCMEVILDSTADLRVDRAMVKKVDKARFSIISLGKKYLVDAENKVRILKVEDITGVLQDDFVVDVNFCQGQEYLHTHSALYSTELRLVKHFPPGFTDRRYVYQVYQSNDRNIFYATDDGLYVNDTVNFFRGERVTGITQDINKNYWAGTLGNGLYSFSASFAASWVWENAYKGTVAYARWAGSALYYCTRENQLYRLGSVNAQSPQELRPLVGDRLAMSAYYLDDQLRFWHFSVHWGLTLQNLAYGTSSLKETKCITPSKASLKEVLEFERVLYINTSSSVVAMPMDIVDKSTDLQCNEYEGGRDRIFDIAAEPRGVWFSTIDGLYRIQHRTVVPVPEYRNVSFKNFCFLGDFLVGITHDNCLLACRESKGSVIVDTIVKDCVWDRIYTIDSNFLLIATNGPYYLMSRDGSSFTVSIVENPFIPLAAELVYAVNDRCYFFRNGSVTSIEKTQLQLRASAPVLAFKSLTTLRRTYPVDSVVEVPYKESGNIVISFTSLSFGSSDVLYQFSMSAGEDDRWVNVVGDINLAKSGYGDYTIKVRARTEGGEFGPPIRFRLTILRPYWATWWFTALSILVVISVFYLVGRARTKASLARKEKEHQDQVRFIRSEYKAMNALMNPHFIFNALNNVQGLVNSNDKLNASEYLGIFADLVRQNMHNINSETIPLQKEMELVENYLLLEKLRFEDQLTYSIDVEDGLFLSEVMVPALLVQPLVENSIKHGILPLKSNGGSGVICIRLHEQVGVLVIEVKDNGVGLSATKAGQPLHKSYGLENLRNRIQQLSILQERKIQFQLIEEIDSTGQPWTVARISISIS